MEVDALARYDIHAGEHLCELTVSPRTGGFNGLLPALARGQLPSDHPVEQQVGGVSEDPWPDHPDRDTGHRQRDHRGGQEPLWGKPLHHANCGAAEIAGALCRSLLHAAETDRAGHANTAWESQISR
ncbi:Uncharacterised protein [Mycobacteroides abscessus subsp. abscessus]|nr:Uncharacterised protein [Mycobacteroides abscessus subsp. abscessus]